MLRSRLLAAAALVATAIAAVPAARASHLPKVEGVPRYDHVFVIVLENQNYATTWGAGSVATYLNSLKGSAAFAEQYYGTGHVSADNYITMTSGQPPTPPFMADCLNWSSCYLFEKGVIDPLTQQSGRNIADQVEGAGRTWKGYMESMGVATPCRHPAFTATNDPDQTGYATRHNPFVYYPTIVDDQSRCNSHVVDYSLLAGDLATDATTPDFVFITPDTCHDGHDASCAATHPGEPGGLKSADDWLSVEVPKILASKAFTEHESLLLITFDENGFTDIQQGYRPPLDFGGRIGLLALGAGVQAGQTVSTPYDHYSLLRTVEDAFGITEYLNLAAAATPMADLFN